MVDRRLSQQLAEVSLRCRRWNNYPRPPLPPGEHRRPRNPPVLRERDSPPRPGDRGEALRRVEAILFLAREPLPSRKLCQYANLADATEARTLVRQLNDRYDENGRAFRVEEIAGGFQLLTRPRFAPWLRRLEYVPREVRLSAPALETLAVVAYRQPTPRAEIEAIRGVNCGEILRQLMERDLVRIQGRSDELGRPYLYGTTKHFLQVFGLKGLDKLPRAEEMKQSSMAYSTKTNGAADVTQGADLEILGSTEEDSRVATTTDMTAADPTPQDGFEKPVSATRNQADAFEEEFQDEEDLDDDEEDFDEFDDDDDDDDDEDDFDDDDDEDDFDDDDDDDEDDFDDDDDDDFDDEYDEEEEDDFDDEEDEWEEVEDDDDLEEEDDWDDDDEEDDEEEEDEDEEWD